MTTQAMTLFQNAPVPAHVAAAFAEEENIHERISTSALTFRGKVWRLRVGGEEIVLTKEVEGEAFPVQSVEVVVLNMNQKRSRMFYEGAYVEGENKSPACWSSDGDKPDADCTTPVAKTCASCPNSVKGSKITANQKETTACSAVKRVAVLPIGKLDMEPLLVKIPQTSMWDKNNAEAEAKGYYAWDQYTDYLRQRGVKHTAAVVTRIRFDPNVAYPKLLFTAVRWLEPQEVAIVAELVNTEAVQKLLVGSINESVANEAAAPAAQAAQAAPEVQAAPAVVVDAWNEDAPQAQAPAAKVTPSKAAKPKPTPAPAQAAPAQAAPVQEAPAAVVAAAPAGAPTNLQQLAAAWDD